MQIYVSKDGQQYGPYTSDQLREYVQQGNFTINDLACHDGQNWVTIGQVPGFAEATQPAAMQAPPASSRNKRSTSPSPSFSTFWSASELLRLQAASGDYFLCQAPQSFWDSPSRLPASFVLQAMKNRGGCSE